MIKLRKKRQETCLPCISLAMVVPSDPTILALSKYVTIYFTTICDKKCMLNYYELSLMAWLVL
jgi:hypothetical protein